MEVRERTAATRAPPRPKEGRGRPVVDGPLPSLFAVRRTNESLGLLPVRRFEEGPAQ